MNRSLILFAEAVLLSILLPRQTQAWSSVGHRTVADIAENHLTPAARERIRSILPPGETLATVATWADDIRNQRPRTKPWHYIDLPVRANVSITNLLMYCASNDLLAQVKKDVAALQGTTGTNQLESLKFLVHFVADMCMPLHCADDGDKGGNQKLVRFFGRSGLGIRGTRMNLHALWDHLIQTEPKENPRRLASQLEHNISQAYSEAWTQGTPEDWVLDTYSVAKQTVYSALPPGPTLQGQEVKLPRSYYSKMRPVAELQIEKAGIRLAALLNRIYDPGMRTSGDGRVTLTEEKLGTGFGSAEH